MERFSSFGLAPLRRRAGDYHPPCETTTAAAISGGDQRPRCAQARRFMVTLVKRVPAPLTSIAAWQFFNEVRTITWQLLNPRG
jgi:hypothetical protein